MEALRLFVAAFFGISMLISCAATKPDISTKVSAKRAYETCREPVEVHEISPYAFPIAAKVMRHSNCLGIADMLFVVWYGERTEKSEVAAKLLALVYAEKHNDAHPNETMVLEHIKTEELKVDDEKTYIMFNVVKVNKKHVNKTPAIRL